jgi:hypothetical protein
MIAIKNVAKFNWNPWVIVGSCVINSSMLYYNETHKGKQLVYNFLSNNFARAAGQSYMLV